MSSRGPPRNPCPSAKVKADLCLPGIPDGRLVVLIRTGQLVKKRQTRPCPPRIQGIPSKPKHKGAINKQVNRTKPRTASSNKTNEVEKPGNFEGPICKIPAKKAKSTPDNVETRITPRGPIQKGKHGTDMGEGHLLRPHRRDKGRPQLMKWREGNARSLDSMERTRQKLSPKDP